MRKLAYFAHVALGLSGAAFFLALTGVLLSRLPVINSLLAHSDQAAANVVQATGVIANASAEQERQAVLIERDVRAVTWKANRSLENVDGLVIATKDQVTHVGPLLDSLKDAANAIPPAINHISTTADASTDAIRSVKQDADDVHGRIESKQVDDFIGYLTDTSKHVDGMSASGDKMLADAQYKTHQLLHPDKVKLGLWGSIFAGVEYVRDHDLPKISLF